MGNIFTYIILGLMVICGGLSSLYVIISIPVVIVWIFFRKVKYGENIMWEVYAMRILLIDDEKQTTDKVQMILKKVM